MSNPALVTIVDTIEFFKEHYEMTLHESQAKHLTNEERNALQIIADIWISGHDRLKDVYQNVQLIQDTDKTKTTRSSVIVSIRALSDISLKASSIGRPGDKILISASSKEIKAEILIPELQSGNYIIHTSKN